MTNTPLTPRPFPPIEGLALLADGETTALVAPSGAVEWLAVPRMDAPTVFGALLDRDAGACAFGPTEIGVAVARRYVPGTLVLETTYMTGSGWLVVTDALLVAPWDDARCGTLPEWRRVPRDDRAAHCLVRHARCVGGSVELELDCDPVFDYGRRRAAWRQDPAHAGRAAVGDPEAGVELTVRTDMRLGVEVGALRGRTTLEHGEEAWFAVGWAGAEPPADLEAVRAQLDHTVRHWRGWLASGEFPDHPWRAQLQRSALVLKGLVYAPTGAIAAAATTSLPEELGGERNWDYRYTWIRDASTTLWALYTLGFDQEAEDFLVFLCEAAGADEDPVQIMYGLGGERELPESELEHLTGYAGSAPVRIGNGAWDQAQHDVWGMLLDAMALHTAAREHVPDWMWPLVEREVEQALARWREPDHGIWEVRNELRHFTSSKVLCWVAADRGARLAERRGEHAHAERWRRAAEEIHADVCAHGLDERGVFVQHYDTDALDASALLVCLMGFLPPGDERVRATVLAIAEELTENGHVLRYRPGEAPDGLEGEEGAFTICSFWLASALVEIGERERGVALCRSLLGHASDLGLYAEQIDPGSGRHLGNTPQAFSHLALINAVMHAVRAEDGDAGDPGRFAAARTTAGARR